MIEPRIEGLRGGIVGESQDAAATNTSQAAGPRNEQEA
jgi:hypothetical protein